MKTKQKDLKQMTRDQQIVYEMLSVGNEFDPVSRKALCERLNTSDRRVRTIVKSLLDYVPVVSKSFGYYIANNVEDIDLYIDSLQSKMSGLAEVIKKLKAHRQDLVKENEF